MSEFFTIFEIISVRSVMLVCFTSWLTSKKKVQNLKGRKFSDDQSDIIMLSLKLFLLQNQLIQYGSKEWSRVLIKSKTRGSCVKMLTLIPATIVSL